MKVMQLDAMKIMLCATYIESSIFRMTVAVLDDELVLFVAITRGMRLNRSK